MQTITETLTAGVAKEWNIPPSRFFMLLETVGPVDVELVSDDGRTVEKSVGVESGFREKSESTGDRISRVKITSTTTQAVKFGYSVRDADNRKVTSSVAVVDGSVERSKNENAYWAAFSKSGLAGEYAYLQLLNPVGSGKICIINEISAYATSGGPATINLKSYDTALSSAATSAINKNRGGADDAIIETYRETNSSNLGTALASLPADAAYKKVTFEATEPLILNPGEGVMLQNYEVAAGIAGSWQYYLEDE